MTDTTATDAAATARRLWRLYEPLHAVTYFSAESRQAASDTGLRGFWMGYVAFRAAPLGPVDAPVVTAAFHGFAPRRIARALPDAWRVVTPEAALRARQSAAGASLRRLLPPADVARAADALQQAADAADTPGRVLAAANQALPSPSDPFERLWQAATTLREHRGDGHVAALVASGLSPVESHLLKVAAGESPEADVRRGRQWSDQEWAAGVHALQQRGLTDSAGALTSAGIAVRRDLEQSTDGAASLPWQRLGLAATEDLRQILRPLAAAAAAELPDRNPIGLVLEAPAEVGPHGAAARGGSA